MNQSIRNAIASVLAFVGVLPLAAFGALPVVLGSVVAIRLGAHGLPVTGVLAGCFVAGLGRFIVRVVMHLALPRPPVRQTIPLEQFLADLQRRQDEQTRRRAEQRLAYEAKGPLIYGSDAQRAAEHEGAKAAFAGHRDSLAGASFAQKGGYHQ